MELSQSREARRLTNEFSEERVRYCAEISSLELQVKALEEEMLSLRDQLGTSMQEKQRFEHSLELSLVSNRERDAELSEMHIEHKRFQETIASLQEELWASKAEFSALICEHRDLTLNYEQKSKVHGEHVELMASLAEKHSAIERHAQVLSEKLSEATRREKVMTVNYSLLCLVYG
jgi:DNA repair exonuclease SbcCD ATPase subunit